MCYNRRDDKLYPQHALGVFVVLTGLNDRMCCFAACQAKRHFVLVGLAYVAFAYSHRVVVGSVDGTVVGCWSAVFVAAGGLFFLVG